MSRNAVPLCLKRGLEQGNELLLVAGERPGHERGPADDRLHAEVERRHGVRLAGGPAEVGVQVGRGRELALGQPVAAVVLDDVEHGDVPPAGVLELAHADVGRVAVAADADAHQLLVGQQGPGGHRGHPAVQGVEAVAVLQEIRRGLARAADAAELDRVIGFTPIDLHASIRWLVMLLWPQPLHRVDGKPWNATVGRENELPLDWMVIIVSLAMGDRLEENQ